MCHSCDLGTQFFGTQLLKKLDLSSLPKSAPHGQQQDHGQTGQETKEEDTVTVFSGGTILTLADGDFSKVDAMVVKGSKIIFTGSLVKAKEQAGPKFHHKNLDGKCLLPGFIECHMHILLTALAAYYFVNLSSPPVATLDDAVRILTDAAKPEKLQQGWVVGFGYDPSRVASHPDLTRTVLDDVTDEYPVFVLNQSGHIAYVNSKALSDAGITAANASDGFQIIDDELTGVIFEEAFLEITPLIPPPSKVDVLSWVRETLNTCAAQGCTTIYEASLGAFGPEETTLIADATAAPYKPAVRLYGAYSELVFDSDKTKPETIGNLHMQGIKFITDGSTQGFTAAVHEEYISHPAGTEPNGISNYPDTAAFTAKMSACVDAGFQLVVHANGDRAIDQTLDAFEALKRQPFHGKAAYPGIHRIDHFTVNHPEQIARAKSLGISLSHTIGHVRFWGLTFINYVLGWDRASRIAPLKDDKASEVVFSIHSDSPVTPVNPLSYIRTAVTRLMDDNGKKLGNQEVDLYTALRCVTLHPAMQLGIDGLVGTLEVGKQADIVILDMDPRKAKGEALDSLKIEETWVGGEQRYPATKG